MQICCPQPHIQLYTWANENLSRRGRENRKWSSFTETSIYLVTFRVRGTMGQQRLRQRVLVEFFNLQQTVSSFPGCTYVRLLSVPATCHLDSHAKKFKESNKVVSRGRLRDVVGRFRRFWSCLLRVDHGLRRFSPNFFTCLTQFYSSHDDPFFLSSP